MGKAQPLLGKAQQELLQLLDGGRRDAQHGGDQLIFLQHKQRAGFLARLAGTLGGGLILVEGAGGALAAGVPGAALAVKADAIRLRVFAAVLALPVGAPCLGKQDDAPDLAAVARPLGGGDFPHEAAGSGHLDAVKVGSGEVLGGHDLADGFEGVGIGEDGKLRGGILSSGHL